MLFELAKEGGLAHAEAAGIRALMLGRRKPTARDQSTGKRFAA